MALAAFLCVSLGRSIDYVFGTGLAVVMVVLVHHMTATQLHVATSGENAAASSLTGIYATSANGQLHTMLLTVLVLVRCLVGAIVQIAGLFERRHPPLPPMVG